MDSRVNFFLLLVVSLARCHQDGAGNSACSTLRPGHGFDPQTTASPYSITVNATEYTTGGSLTGNFGTIDSSSPVTLQQTFYI